MMRKTQRRSGTRRPWRQPQFQPTPEARMCALEIECKKLANQSLYVAFVAARHLGSLRFFELMDASIELIKSAEQSLTQTGLQNLRRADLYNLILLARSRASYQHRLDHLLLPSMLSLTLLKLLSSGYVSASGHLGRTYFQ
eukprot:4377505-Pleurochrysis_carterae.AAC.1